MSTPQTEPCTKHDARTGQYAPAIRHPDGRVVTYSPTSFDEARALEIARTIHAQTLTETATP